MKLKTIKGYKALAIELNNLGLNDHALDSDNLKELPKDPNYPHSPYVYSNTVAWWKGKDGYYSWPEIKHATFEIHKLS